MALFFLKGMMPHPLVSTTMTNHSVFNSRERTNVKGKQPAERGYPYLNSSARPEAEKVRLLVDDWYRKLPAAEQPDWRGRFCSEDDAAHHGAFFELVIHEWLLRLGYKVEPHPTLAGSAKRPDFRATHDDGRGFFLEARSTDGNSPDELRTERFCEQVTQEISGVPSPDFFLFVHIVHEPTQQPALRKLRESVVVWLATLDYETLLAAKDPDAFSQEFEVGGGLVVLRPSPKSNRRGSPEGFGGLMIGGVRQVDTQSTIDDTGGPPPQSVAVRQYRRPLCHRHQ